MKIKAGNWYACVKECEASMSTHFKVGCLYKCNMDDYLRDENGVNYFVGNPDNYFVLRTSDMPRKGPKKVSNEDHKDYYEEGRKITPFDVIIDWELDFFLATVVKYIARIGRKQSANLSRLEKDLQDIRKAKVYLDKKEELIIKEINKDA